jgi:hypothetical protein
VRHSRTPCATGRRTLNVWHQFTQGCERPLRAEQFGPANGRIWPTAAVDIGCRRPCGVEHVAYARAATRREGGSRRRLDFRKVDSSFYRALHISYPGPSDLAAARSQRIDPRGLVMLPGMKNGLGWLGRLPFCGRPFVLWANTNAAGTRPTSIQTPWRLGLRQCRLRKSVSSGSRTLRTRR